VPDLRLKSVVVVGGGIEGWMAAAALAERFHDMRHTSVTLVESPGRVAATPGASTVPHFREFLQRLRINEGDFIRRTGATVKLATAFEGWAGERSEFFHAFSDHGVPQEDIPFHHFWVKLRRMGKAAEIDRYSLASELARAGKFALPRADAGPGFMTYAYALNFDVALATRYLKSWSMLHGVKLIEGECAGVRRHPETGDVESVTLDGGRDVAAEFFIDCTGPRAVLIEQALGIGYDDWSQWLPCDREVVVRSGNRAARVAYTSAVAGPAGWRGRVPLQGCIDSHSVYSSRHLSDDAAAAALRSVMEGPPLAEPVSAPIRNGVRRQAWSGNVFCLGPAGGCLDPLHSTGLWLVQRGLQFLQESFPQSVPNPVLREDVNRRYRAFHEQLRDFLILPYILNGRTGEPFWDECRHLAIPDTLRETIELFRGAARVPNHATEYLPPSAWLSVFAGCGVLPNYYHPQVDEVAEEELVREFEKMAAGIVRLAAGAPGA
jgi:tryptophan halogenase